MGRAKRLTSEVVRKLQNSARTKTLSDPSLPGLYLRINRSSKTWIAQRSVAGRQRRVTLGRFPEVSAEAAREKALKALAAMGEGRDPAEERRQALARGVTLREALETHLASARIKAKTAADYRWHVERYLGDWLNRPLRELGRDRSAVRERHAQLTGAGKGRTADYALQAFRAIYNRALREHPELPPNPCAAVDFRGIKRRTVGLDADRLSKWGPIVLTLSPVRRDLHLFMLMTGMRRTAACTARSAHVDLAAGVLRVPMPKGGAERAFDLPLSAPLLDLIRHRLDENEMLKHGTLWLFPSTSKTGHASETKEPKLGGLHGHALRHAFAKLAREAGVPIAELKLLLNHRLPGGDVTFGYLELGLEHLRKYQATASASILAAVGLNWTAGSWPPVEEREQ